jgi:putative two-component system response regulator
MAIVIVDDSPTNLAVLKSLSANIYKGEVKAFTNARAAVQHLADHSVDLIVVDYSMPDLNGIDFIREIRANPRHLSTPLVMVTQSSDLLVRTRAIEAGATDFLNKPVDAIEFKVRIKHLLSLNEPTTPAGH